MNSQCKIKWSLSALLLIAVALPLAAFENFQGYEDITSNDFQMDEMEDDAKVKAINHKKVENEKPSVTAINKKLAPILSPIAELLESQWGGEYSVIMGATYLEKLLDFADGGIDKFGRIKRSLLYDVRKLRITGMPRPITSYQTVINNYLKQSNSPYKNDISAIMKRARGTTICESREFSLDSAFYFGAGVGIFQRTFFTPLGRKLTEIVPIMGLNLGFGATVSREKQSKFIIETTDLAKARIKLTEHGTCSFLWGDRCNEDSSFTPGASLGVGILLNKGFSSPFGIRTNSPDFAVIIDLFYEQFAAAYHRL